MPSAVVLLLLAALCAEAGVGRMSIAGYTANDQQAFGPALERIVNDTSHGTHVVWKADNADARYNFYGRVSESWHWPEGKPVFPWRSSLGNICLSPSTGAPYIVGSYLDRGKHHAIVAWDTLIGSGQFNWVAYSGYYDSDWTLIALVSGGSRHYLALRRDSVTYHRGASPYYLGRIGSFPTHNFTGSRTTRYLAGVWTRTEEPNIGTLYLRVSTDLGYIWKETTAISRTIPDGFRNAFLGAYALYDRENVLHIVSNTFDGTNRRASGIWHYTNANPAGWNLVHAFSDPQSSGELPSEALIAGRPSIGEDTSANLFAIWEQFDPGNPDGATQFLRSDIWAARSEDGGRTWGQAVRLTEPDNTSKRYPSLARVVDENLHLAFLIDSVAGFAAQGQGRETRNPVAYLQFPASLLPGAIAEHEPRGPRAPAGLTAWPNPARSRAGLGIPANLRPGRLQICNSEGRLVREWLVSDARTGLLLDWKLDDTKGSRIPPGIYFGRIGNCRTQASVRIVVL